ncbi:hypothetical protein [Rhodoferax sp.]|uniref:hypothetical protein n=1 Tax=Rhodoferax sp. TaxID=50421 RepID=UPI00374CD254
MSVEYDPAIINKFAGNLYARAGRIVAAFVFIGLVVGVIGGASLSAYMGIDRGSATGLGAIVGGLFGYSIGSGIAFKLRLQAQIALCQVAIEKNTRKPLPEPTYADPISAS